VEDYSYQHQSDDDYSNEDYSYNDQSYDYRNSAYSNYETNSQQFFDDHSQQDFSYKGEGSMGDVNVANFTSDDDYYQSESNSETQQVEYSYNDQSYQNSQYYNLDMPEENNRYFHTEGHYSTVDLDQNMNEETNNYNQEYTSSNEYSPTVSN
jgi:hypothetical protein